VLDRPDVAKLVLRISLGGMMLLHGIDKLHGGIAGLQRLVENKGLPGFVAYGVYVGEVVAPLFVIAGWKTRIAALVFAFNMLVAVLLAHSGDIVRLGRHGEWAIELQMLYMLGAVAIALLGAGKYSVSRGRGRWD
jgi:putative oxidoreductase